MADEALVFVRRGRELLVLLRHPRDGGYWHPVSGAVEAGESDADAAARELREETGLRAARLEPLGDFAYGAGVTSSCFVTRAPAGWEPELNDEHTDYRWCSREEAERLLHWPEPRALLEAACAS
jgi:dATP pyrophosphohydrolase